MVTDAAISSPVSAAIRANSSLFIPMFFQSFTQKSPLPFENLFNVNALRISIEN